MEKFSVLCPELIYTLSHHCHWPKQRLMAKPDFRKDNLPSGGPTIVPKEKEQTLTWVDSPIPYIFMLCPSLIGSSLLWVSSTVLLYWTSGNSTLSTPEKPVLNLWEMFHMKKMKADHDRDWWIKSIISRSLRRHIANKKIIGLLVMGRQFYHNWITTNKITQSLLE